MGFFGLVTEGCKCDPMSFSVLRTTRKYSVSFPNFYSELRDSQMRDSINILYEMFHIPTTNQQDNLENANLPVLSIIQCMCSLT